jgi:outer membrane protein assembly factor BamB
MPQLREYRDRTNPTQGSVPAVDLDSNRVFVGSADNYLYCVRFDTGEVIWRIDTGAAVRSNPLYVKETRTVFFGNDNGELWAVGADRGERRWVYEAEAEIRQQAVVAGEALYVATADNSVHALDWSRGISIWRHRQEEQSSEFQVSGHAGVAVDDQAVYAGFSDGTVAALDVYDGSVLWSRALVEETELRPRSLTGLPVLEDVDTTPVVQGHRVFVASYDGGIHALERQTGAVLWHNAIKGATGLALGPQTLYASCAAYGVVALNAITGRTRWRRPLGRADYYQPQAFRDLVVVADSQRGLTALHRRDGSVVHRFSVGAGAGAAGAIAASHVLILSKGGLFSALAIR